MSRPCQKVCLGLFLLAACGLTARGEDPPTYAITPIGLIDDDHTGNKNFRSTTMLYFNAAGHVAGDSLRFFSDGTGAGQSTWVFNGTNTIRVCFFDAEHTGTNNKQFSIQAINYLNASGQIVGESLRYFSDGKDAGQTAWLYSGGTTTKLGFATGSNGSEFVRADGYRKSTPFMLNGSGQAAGTSDRYIGQQTDPSSGTFNQAAWVYDGKDTTTRVGFTDADHTRGDGLQTSILGFFTESGKAAGGSRRFTNTDTEQGQSAWVYDGKATTTRVGLFDAEHTRTNPAIFGTLQISFVVALNEAGQAAGYSYRYDTGLSTSTGQSAWVYNGTTTVKVGFTDAEHDDSPSGNGRRTSQITHFNAAGQAAGYSYRYNGGATQRGQTAWVTNGSNTVKVGFYDTEHTQSGTGYKGSGVSWFNDAGHAVGTSSRFNGSNPAGNSAWVYNGSATVRIGLTDPEHTGPSNFQSSAVPQTHFIAANRIAGYSEQFGTGSQAGRSTWVYDGSNTTRVGLVDDAHKRATDNYRYSEIGFAHFNAAGHAAGISHRFDNTASTDDSPPAKSAWVYKNGTTTNVGLAGPEFIRNDGYRSSVVGHLNSSGQAAGFSERYSGADYRGLTAWVYDGTTTIPIVLSTKSDGTVESGIYYFDDTGLALGSYTLFSGSTSQERAFAYTATTGAYDLGLRVVGGLSANGWGNLAYAIRESDTKIYGAGLLADMNPADFGQVGYVLVPSTAPIPEPSTVLGVAALGLAGMRLLRRVRSPLRGDVPQ